MSDIGVLSGRLPIRSFFRVAAALCIFMLETEYLFRAIRDVKRYFEVDDAGWPVALDRLRFEDSLEEG
jgi:hypothetical protein